MNYLRIFVYCLLLTLFVVGCFFAYHALRFYAPCTFDVRLEANEVKYISSRVKSFQLKYKRLPDIKSPTDLKLLGLNNEVADKITNVDERHFTVFSSDGRGFDGQSATYDSRLDTVTCDAW